MAVFHRSAQPPCSKYLSSTSSSTVRSMPSAVFSEDFVSFLSFAATTHHEFIITDNTTSCRQPWWSSHLSLPSFLFSFDLTQHVHFSTRDKDHILNSVITPSDSLLALSFPPTALVLIISLFSPYSPQTVPFPPYNNSVFPPAPLYKYCNFFSTTYNPLDS